MVGTCADQIALIQACQIFIIQSRNEAPDATTSGRGCEGGGGGGGRRLYRKEGISIVFGLDVDQLSCIELGDL